MSSLVFPPLAPLYQVLGPIAEALLRVIVGLALVPHGLRMCFGLFAGTAGPVRSIPALAAMLDRKGYRPGMLWACVIAATELVGGPMLALGLLTRPVAIPITILLALSVVDHWRDGWFWNRLGIEYPLMWTAGALYFLANGGGAWSLDRLIGWQF
jgi:putative oxidoreductase